MKDDAPKYSNLVSLAVQVAQIETALYDADGEVTPEIEAALSIRDFLLPAKIDSYAHVMERMAMLEEYYKTKAKELEKLSKSYGSIIERCEGNLREALRTIESKTIEGNEVIFRLSPSNPKVIIENENLVNDSYKVTETVTKIDKKKIAEDLKIGVPVEGAHLEESFSLRKSVNRSKK